LKLARNLRKKTRRKVNRDGLLHYAGSDVKRLS